MMPRVPGSRSCSAKVGRLGDFGRRRHEVRLHAGGELPADDQAHLGADRTPVPDGTLRRFPRGALGRGARARPGRRNGRGGACVGPRARHAAERRGRPHGERPPAETRLARRALCSPAVADTPRRSDRQADRDDHRSHRVRRGARSGGQDGVGCRVSDCRPTGHRRSTGGGEWVGNRRGQMGARPRAGIAARPAALRMASGTPATNRPA